MDPEAAEFLSFEGALALGALLIALGKTADWLLLKQQKTLLLDRVAVFGDRLRGLRFKQAQLALVRALLAFLTTLSVPWTVRKHHLYTGKAEDELDGVEVFALLLGFVSRPFQLLVALVVLALWALGWLDFAYAGLLVVFAFVLLARFVLWILHVAAVGYELDPDPKTPAPAFLQWIERSRTLGLLDILGPRMLAISFLLTVAALEVGMAYWRNPRTTAWFSVEQGALAPTAPVTLALLNLPFDILALLVTIAMLRFALRRNLPISLVALTDIAATLVLAFLLLTVLLAWPSPDPQAWTAAAGAAFVHLLRVYTFAASAQSNLFPLDPLLFTPFAPIAFYLLLPVLIALLLAPLLRLAAHICMILHQREQSPFLVFAIAAAGLLGLAKVFSAWPWFAGQIAAALR
jgi:hypothetical protein